MEIVIRWFCSFVVVSSGSIFGFLLGFGVILFFVCMFVYFCLGVLCLIGCNVYGYGFDKRLVVWWGLILVGIFGNFCVVVDNIFYRLWVYLF